VLTCRKIEDASLAWVSRDRWGGEPAWSLTVALVTWSVYGMRRIRRKHLLSNASTLSRKARVMAHVSEPYNKTGWL